MFDLDRVITASDAAPADLAEGSNTVMFQRGLNGYDGVIDTTLESATPDTAYGSAAFIAWELESSQEAFALIRFDDLFGTAADRIPPGATILEATLTVVIQDDGDLAEIHEIEVPWTEASTTYRNFGVAEGAEAGVDYDATIVAIAEPSGAGTYTVAVTSSLAAWSHDPASNRGWIFVPTSTSRVVIESSEVTATTSRPRLSVIYQP